MIGVGTTIFLVNPVTFGGSSFTNDYSMQLDGVDEYVNAGRVTATESAANLSISCWCYFDGLRAAGDHPIGKYSSSTDSFFLQILSDGKLSFNVSNGATQRGFTAAGTISSGSWFHIVATYNGGGATNTDKYKVYVNGLNYALSGFVAGLGPATTSTDTGNLLLGKAGTGAAAYFDGKLDEMAWFDYALDSTQVTSLYNSGTPTDLDNTSGVTAPVHWWRMGDGADSYDGTNWTINDVGTTGGNNGTSVNMEVGDRVTDTP